MWLKMTIEIFWEVIDSSSDTCNCLRRRREWETGKWHTFINWDLHKDRHFRSIQNNLNDEDDEREGRRWWWWWERKNKSLQQIFYWLLRRIKEEEEGMCSPEKEVKCRSQSTSDLLGLHIILLFHMRNPGWFPGSKQLQEVLLNHTGFESVGFLGYDSSFASTVSWTSPSSLSQSL